MNTYTLYPNYNNLPGLIILNRLLALDPNAECFVYEDNQGGQPTPHVVRIDSSLTGIQITTLLSTVATTAELATVSRLTASKTNAKNIPSWATWTEAEAQTWGNTNIGTPLTTGRSSLPATLTLATTRTAIIMLLNILDKMWAMQWALARMVIAIRDKTWPDLPQT